MPRTMSLTPELVARCHRDMADPGPDPALSHLDEGDYAALVEAMLEGRAPDEPVWLFAYGSLIWKPEIEHEEELVAAAHGWHRSFCLTLTRWRGTPQTPGLMLGLDRGGACRGLALRLPDGDRRQQLDKLFRREMTVKPPSYHPRWMQLSTERGPLRALGFVINRGGPNYAGPLADDAVAAALASACGHWGSGADYLHNVVANLEARGIHDRHLWRLQELVAARILSGE